MRCASEEMLLIPE